MNPQISNLLRWSIENSTPSTSTTTSPADHPTAPTAPPTHSVNADALAALFGGPSDADLMKQSMAAILSPDITLYNKLIAFDNLEQLIESIDNANNLESVGLWTPLIELLQHGEKDLRRMAAWCVGTAVQNNGKAQERLLIMNGIPALVRLVAEDEDEGVRRKAAYALSSEIRNYQPGTDAAIRALPKELAWRKTVDAADMGDVDEMMERLKAWYGRGKQATTGESEFEKS